MPGTLTDIVEIVAPDSAVRGARVDVAVRVENIDTVPHLISCKANYNGVLFIDEAVRIHSLSAYVFTGHLTMPSKDVTISAGTYYPSGDLWIHDDAAEKNVALKASPVGCLPLVLLGLILLATIATAIVTIAS